MERGSITKWLFLGVAVFFFFQYGYPKLFGSDEKSELQPLGPAYTFPDPDTRPPEATCQLTGERFEAALSTRGASLRSVRLTDPKYVQTVMEPDAPQIELVTTNPAIPGVWESRMPLRADLRVPLAPDDLAQQVPFDDFDWTLAEQSSRLCRFVFENDDVKVEKRVAVPDRPFELDVTLTIENKSDKPRSHRLSLEQASFRKTKETKGSFGLLSEFLTSVVANTETGTHRLEVGDFDPDEFQNPEFTAEKWWRAGGTARWISVSSSYLALASIHVSGPAEPTAELLIEENFDAQRFPNKEEDPDFGHTYRARLVYPERELAPGESVTYESIGFVGPMERDVLATVGGPGPEGTKDRFHTTEIIDLGFFGAIGRVLVGYIYFLYGLVGNWGWAICLLTITVKCALFPLSLAQIKSGVAMRRLKPEMDEINKKYKDDATQRGLAIQELWRREKVSNPVVGCVPLLLQMPVWFALYKVLQTAVELYHMPFGPFIPDMSQPGRYYIIPAVLGVSSFIQQSLMPPQGDPAQQKMMKYAMPGMFTVFMLFLPAGLGVYMLTNTWLGILQTVAVERWMKGRLAKKQAEGRQDDETNLRKDDKSRSRGLGGEKDDGAAFEAAPALRKGKARARG